jgi:hypothetical protein
MRSLGGAMYYIEGVLGMMFATLLQLPFQLILGAPFVIPGVLFLRLLRRWRLMPRIALASAVIAAGIAPIYGFHASMLPAYLIVFSKSHPPSAAQMTFAPISYFCTFAVVCIFLYLMLSKAKRRGLLERKEV